MPAKKRKVNSGRAASTREAPKSKRAKASAKATSTQPKAEETTSPSQPSEPSKMQTRFTPYPPSKVYRLIEPGPVLLVSTGSSDPTSSDPSNDINLMTIGFHMMLQHASPPLIAVCIGPWDATYARLKASRECVLAVPSVDMADVVVDVGNCSADDLVGPGAGEGGNTKSGRNKFERFGLTALPARKVGAPLVATSTGTGTGTREGAEEKEGIIANVECVVEDDAMVERYNLWVLKVVAAWVNEERMVAGHAKGIFHHRGDGTFTVDGERVLDLRDRMVKWRMFQD
ncbi:uncharacterized protein B0T15DRAFT_525098 [Chaetomium strumarium]|uniref:Flavin reductase like domain-containing protein n=1 Tax=Chaetomium strumarium TaxID=1170767 RepID=A0AAJ0M4Q1_9PEZI|nr:hypothetical protein B0T15DRAFT_525098 [Chaetomium strumarium]